MVEEVLTATGTWALAALNPNTMHLDPPPTPALPHQVPCSH